MNKLQRHILSIRYDCLSHMKYWHIHNNLKLYALSIYDLLRDSNKLAWKPVVNLFRGMKICLITEFQSILFLKDNKSSLASPTPTQQDSPTERFVKLCNDMQRLLL